MPLIDFDTILAMLSLFRIASLEEAFMGTQPLAKQRELLSVPNTCQPLHLPFRPKPSQHPCHRTYPVQRDFKMRPFSTACFILILASGFATSHGVVTQLRAQTANCHLWGTPLICRSRHGAMTSAGQNQARSGQTLTLMPLSTHSIMRVLSKSPPRAGQLLTRCVSMLRRPRASR